MLTILLNPSNPEPLYQQICTAIREDIAQGVLHPDEKLPSRRALSAHLQTSIVTVQTAYEQLAAEGYLYSRPRAGYFVDPDAPLLAHMPKKRLSPHHSWQRLTRTTNCFPPAVSIWSSFLCHMGKTFQTGAFLQTGKAAAIAAGNGLVRTAGGIAAHLRAFRDIHAAPEQILVGAGTEYLLGILVQLLGASRRYAVEEPGYSKGKRILRSNGASVIDVPMDQNGLQLAALQQSGASVAHVTPSHQFPTGMIMPVRRRAELLAWASAQTDRYLIEDDYDSELRFLGKPLPSLYSMDNSGHVIYMNTFARTLAPSLRIGYVVPPPPLAKQFEQDFSFYSSSVPSFEQYTLVHFLQEGYFERHLNRMKKTYRQRQKRLTELLRSHPLGAYLHICGEAAGLHLLLEVQLPCTEQELVQAAAAAHVVVYGLSDYYETPQASAAYAADRTGLRLSFAGGTGTRYATAGQLAAVLK
ncbi:MAG: PLP-dependent aminotransferase family protein [Ruminococcus callidus]